MKMNKVFLLLFMLLAFVSCGGGGGSSDPPPTVTLESITITSAVDSLPAGQTTQLTATATYSDNVTEVLSKDVVWSVSDETSATISSTGLLSCNIKQDDITITATSATVSGTLSFDFTDPVLESLVVSAPHVSIPAGQEVQIQTLGVFSNDSTSDLSGDADYTLSDNANANISPTGLITDVTGAVTVTVCVNSICQDLEITRSSATIDSIAVSAASTTTSTGLTLQFSALASYDDGSTMDISNTATWDSSNDGVATPGTTTPSQFDIIMSGSFFATATFGADSDDSDLITVNNETLESITISLESGDYPQGYFTYLTATGHFTNNYDQDITGIVTWTVDDTAIAAFPNTNDGYESFIITKTAGEVSVTAEYALIEATESIVITDVTFGGVDIRPDATASYLPLVLDTDSQIDLDVYGLYSDGSEVDLSSVCQWYTPANDIVSIDTNGVVTPSTTGNWGIVAVIGGIYGLFQPVSVIKPVSSYTISVTHSTIPTHADISFTAQAEYTDTTTGDITNLVLWNSEDPAIIRFYDDIRSYAHGMSIGNSTISGSLLLNGDTSVLPTANIQMVVEPLNSIGIVPYDADNGIAETLDETIGFWAFGKCTGNEALFTITNYVEWTSNNESYITISDTLGSKGVITINDPDAGPATITAAVDNGTGTETVSNSFGPIP